MPAGKTSAGVIVYRRTQRGIEVLIAHPGGPFWRNRDKGAWTIPKGELESDEDPRAAAVRELAEETGLDLTTPDAPPLVELGTVRLASGKIVHAWAAEADMDPVDLVSNTFTMVWPPKSGLLAEFREIDRVEWVSHEEALVRLNPALGPLIVRLVEHLTS
ncbi:MAG: NUDIX domain-containing protein [Acidimicrobiia bacterium]